MKHTIIILMTLIMAISIYATQSPNGYTFTYEYSDSQISAYSIVNQPNVTVDFNGTNCMGLFNYNSYVNSAQSDASFPIEFLLTGQPRDRYSFTIKVDGRTTFDDIISWYGIPIYIANPTLAYGKHTLEFKIYNERGAPLVDIIGLPIEFVIMPMNTVYQNPNKDRLSILKTSSQTHAITKPMLLVSGIDQNNCTNYYYEFKNSLDTFTDVPAGSDIYLMEFNNGRNDMRDNAISTLAAARFLNSLYSSNIYLEGTTLVGFSIGGVIARYALAFAEDHNIQHYCSQLITYDSPHRGASLNVDFQNKIDNIRHDLNDFWLHIGASFTGESYNLNRGCHYADFMKRTFNSTSAKQLYRTNKYATGTNDYISGTNEFLNFYSEINLEERLSYLPDHSILNNDVTNPNNKPGFPYKQNHIQCIALSNGAISQSGNINDTNYLGEIHIANHTYRPIAKDYDTQPGSTFPLDFIENSSIDCTINYNPVFASTRSSLYLKPQSNSNPTNSDPQFTIGCYDNITIPQGQDMNQYLTDHSYFNSSLARIASTDPVHNWSFSSIDTGVTGILANGFAWSYNPLNRAVGFIQGNVQIDGNDYSGITVTAFLGETPLCQPITVDDEDGSFSVPYTFVKNVNIKLVFLKTFYYPIIRNVAVTYSNGSISYNLGGALNLLPIDYNLATNTAIVHVSHTPGTPIQTINDAVDLLEWLYSEWSSMGYPMQFLEDLNVKIQLEAGTYPENVDLSGLLPYRMASFTLQGINNPIIEGSNGAYCVNLTTSDLGTNNHSVYTVDHITFTHAKHGLFFEDTLDELNNNTPYVTLTVKNCTFANCGGSNFTNASGGGIHFSGAGSIEYNNFSHNTMASLHDNSMNMAGALYVNNNSNSTVNVKFNTFTNNSGSVGGALVINGTGQINVFQNSFTGNYEGGYANGKPEGNALSVFNVHKAVINNNKFINNMQPTPTFGSVVKIYTLTNQSGDPIEFCNNTIYDAPQYAQLGPCTLSFKILGGVNLQDIYIYNNVFSCSLPNSSDVNSNAGYSPDHINNNVFDNVAPNGFTINTTNQSAPKYNLVCNPQLDANYIPIWNQTTMSPCIDAGIGENDPDGTPADIGAIPAVTHAFWSYTFRKSNAETQPNLRSDTWHWVSYPVINSITQGKTIARSFFSELLGIHPISSIENEPDVLQTILWKDNNTDYSIVWEHHSDDSWAWSDQTDIHHVNSPQGYKIKLLPFGDAIPVNYPPVVLHHSGFPTSPTSTFTIHGSDVEHDQIYENWIGYFDTECQWPQDAFASIWNDIIFIKAKDWCLYRSNRNNNFSAIEGTMLPIKCGDMVVIATYSDHQFQWETSNTVDPIEKEKAIHFTFEEKPDYTPVEISLSGIDKTDLKEIALKLNGICKGAVVVKNDVEQLCAYLDVNEKLTEGTVELIFYYESKSQPQELKSINIDRTHLSSNSMGGVSEYPVYHISVTPNDMTDNTVPILSLEQNYPNPFNTTTNIKYSLDEPGAVSIEIYNIKGQLVKTLIQGNAEKGVHSVVWDGIDHTGNPCSSGVYFYKLRTNSGTLVRKMLMLK